MFKLPDKVPSLYTSAQDWADYAEYQALQRGKVALLSLSKIPGFISDETRISGVENDSDNFINKADDIASEIRKRKDITRNQYPFELANRDYNLLYVDSDSLFNWVYLFLLLATRLNMRDEKMQGGLDGSTIFERLCAEIACAFFGNNAKVDILGTSKRDLVGFRAKLSHITKQIGEGGQIHKNAGFRPQDDKVDVIVWKGFTDRLSSQVIAFGQCKTGTSWQNTLTELSTDGFCRKWFSEQPVHHPLRLFFCAQYFPREIWRPRAIDAGLVFDRFRIIDYLPATLDDSLLADIKTWCIAAKNRYENTSVIVKIKKPIRRK